MIDGLKVKLAREGPIYRVESTLMLHLPTLLAVSFVTCGVVTVMLLLTRVTLGSVATGALSWVVGDMLLQAARLATVAERNPELLPDSIAQIWPATPDVIVPGALMLVAIWCHRIALRRAEGTLLHLRQRALQVAAIITAWCVVGLQLHDFESRTRLLAVALVLVLLPLALSSWRLARRYWGARLILVLSSVALLANIGRAAGVMAEPVGSESKALAALFMLNIVATLAVTMGFVVMVQEQVRQRILAASLTDPLTGLFNRRGLLQSLERDLDRSRRGETPLSIALFDLDHFKKINDAHGHKAGDAVLAAFAECLRSQSRRGDLLGRWGGEEFIIAMPGTASELAVGVAERIRGALRGCDWSFGAVTVTVSAGVAQNTTSQSETAEQLIDRADQRLYRAKERRDRVCAN